MVTSGVYSQSGRPIAQAETDGGRIDGTVYYEDGRPVKDATVYADPLGRKLGAIIPHADTNEAGYFTIHVPRSWFGKFSVTAEKDTEDYPRMHYQFYSNGKFETVTLTPAHPSASVSIHIGPKAGVLEGTVTDAATGARLRPCVEFRRAANPNNFLSGSGLMEESYNLTAIPLPPRIEVSQ